MECWNGLASNEKVQVDKAFFNLFVDMVHNTASDAGDA